MSYCSLLWVLWLSGNRPNFVLCSHVWLARLAFCFVKFCRMQQAYAIWDRVLTIIGRKLIPYLTKVNMHCTTKIIIFFYQDRVRSKVVSTTIETEESQVQFMLVTPDWLTMMPVNRETLRELSIGQEIILICKLLLHWNVLKPFFAQFLMSKLIEWLVSCAWKQTLPGMTPSFKIQKLPPNC